MISHQPSPYPSRRNVVYGRGGMVATSQPLAAQAGLDVLHEDGNAIDAAVATAAALTVLEPTSNGIGGDAFALIWSGGRLHGLNASGPAPRSITIDDVRSRGHETMPVKGWLPVTVPGAPAAWSALTERFGALGLARLLAPASSYARDGFPVSPAVARNWARAAAFYPSDDATHDEWHRVFAPGGRVPGVGDVVTLPDHANTLDEIAATRADSFYKGALAERIAAASEAGGGFLTADDLAAFHPEWVEPISTNYRGYDVWEIPPNGQGIVALAALNILEGFAFDRRDRDGADTIHKTLEALKIAFTEAQRVVTDPSHMPPADVERLLSSSFAEEARLRITDRALDPGAVKPPTGGTVYLATADAEGNMVSYIQSNYMGFGSGVVVPGTGIALQNRGADFSLDPAHANALAGGKRSYHTIIPGFLTRGGAPIGPFGVMGGYMQPQGHVQVVMNTVDFGLNPQAALDAPRYRWDRGLEVELEREMPDVVAQALVEAGHDVRIATRPGGFGNGQIIWRDPDTGVLAGGTESRCDGAVVAF